MIREFQNKDSKQIMEIWLNGNTDAHPFIPKEYWEANFEMVEKQLLDSAKALHSDLTLHVYQKNKRAIEFYKREGFSITSENIDSDTGEIDKTMHWPVGEK